MYSIMLELKNKNITLVGGGNIAARKIKALIGQGASIKVISPSLHRDIDRKAIIWNKKKYEKDDIKDADLIFACTNSPKINEQIKRDALPHQWVNVVSNKELSDFFNMATFDWKDFKINISSEGVSPSKTKKLKEKIIKLLDNIDNL